MHEHEHTGMALVSITTIAAFAITAPFRVRVYTFTSAQDAHERVYVRVHVRRRPTPLDGKLSTRERKITNSQETSYAKSRALRV